MRGAAGFNPYKNTIIINLNTLSDDWENALYEIVPNEYNHSVVRKYNNWNTLLQTFVFEGFAEHFREEVVGGKRAAWEVSVSKQECKKQFRKIRKKLNSTSFKTYSEIFFYSKDYPPWLGYSISFNMVIPFLKNNKDKRWIDIIRANPSEAYRQSEFY